MAYYILIMVLTALMGFGLGREVRRLRNRKLYGRRR